MVRLAGYLLEDTLSWLGEGYDIHFELDLCLYHAIDQNIAPKQITGGMHTIVLLAGIILVYFCIWDNWIWYDPILSFFTAGCHFLSSLLLGLTPFGILGLKSIDVLGKSIPQLVHAFARNLT